MASVNTLRIEYGFNCVGSKELSGYVLSLYEKRVEII